MWVAPSSSSSWLRDSPPPPRECRVLGAHAVVKGGLPLRQGLACALWARVVCPPPPPAHARFERAVGAGGTPLVPVPCRAGRCWVGVPPPPSADARVKPAEPFRGAPRLHLSSVRLLLWEHALRFFAPLLRPSWCHAGLRGPMAVISGVGPLRWPDLSLSPPTPHCGTCGAGACRFWSWRRLCRRSALAGAPRHRLHRRAWRHRSSAACRAVSNVGSLPPGCLGGGWVFVPYPPPPSVSPRWYWDAVRAPGVLSLLGTLIERRDRKSVVQLEISN